MICGIQLEFGVGARDRPVAAFGPGNDHAGADGDPGRHPEPAARRKLAYACLPAEEVAFWDAQLLGLDAHTGRRVVPMCFEAETFGS